MDKTNKKELLPHEKTLESFIDKTEAMNAYVNALSLRTEDIIYSPKEQIIKEKGLEEATNFLTTNEGHDFYGDLAAKQAQKAAIDEFKLDKNKFNTEELEILTKRMYDINKKTLTEFAREYGPNVHAGKFIENYLDDHIKKLTATTIQNHILQYDTKHNHAILDHICQDSHKAYFKKELLDELSNDNMKPHIWNAYKTWNKGGQKLGLDYFRNSEFWSLFLKDEHKDDKQKYFKKAA